MKNRSAAFLLSLSVAAFAAACDQAPPPPGDGDIDLNPATLDAAQVTINRLDQLQKRDPAAAARAYQTLQPRLDALNHVVARVEPTAGHVVTFYESEPGVIGVGERAPIGSESILRAEDVNGHSVTDLYRTLAGGAEPPSTLVAAEARNVPQRLPELPANNDALLGANVASSAAQALATASASRGPVVSSEGIGSSTEALTAADGPWWASNVCYKTGDARGCMPNWANGGWAQASAKTSFFQVAGFSGSVLSVRFQYEGTTKFTDPVFPGDWKSWWWHSDSFWNCCFICACGTQDYNRRLHRWDILNASGDGFHWTYSFKWSCGDTISCDATP
jgi:hypothetical protein